MLELDLHWRRGEFSLQAHGCLEARVTGLCGESGSGKSSLLALIAGLQRPDQGWIRLDGDTLVDRRRGIWVPPERRRIGLMFQDAQLFPHLSVLANLRYGHDRRAPADRRFRLDDIVSLLEIAPLLTRRPGRLSGGEKQRVALGRALLYSPRLLLLDEPLAALDERRKQQILPFLLRIRHELALPMIYVSHASTEVELLAETVWQMESGVLSRVETAVRP